VVFVDRLTESFLRHNIISEDQTEWCAYVLEGKIANLISLVILLVVGTLAADFPAAVVINAGMLFLRKKTNGYHAKTFLGCLCISVFCEYTCLRLLPWLNQWKALTLLSFSALVIFLFAPFNSSNMHFDEREMSALKQCVRRRLVIFCFLAVVLLLVQPEWSFCLCLTSGCVAIFLILSKLGFGTQ